MKKGWQTKHLGDVATVGAGNSAPQDGALFRNGTIPFFRTADAGRVRFGDLSEAGDYLNNNGAKGLRRFPPGTILFPKSGASTFLNHRVMLGVEGCVSSHLATIVADEKQAYPRYLLYFLSSVSAQDLVQDHAYPSLNLPTISGIEIHLPTLTEQKRIVGVLDEAFEGIATAKANAEKNLENAHAIFESHLQYIFTKRGEGWAEKTLAELCDPSRIITYGVIKLGDDTPNGVPCLRTSNVRWLRIETAGMKRIAPSLSSEYSRTILKGGEVLVNVRGTLGGVAVAEPEMAGWNVSREVAMVPVDPSRINPKFLSYLIGAGASQNWLGDVKKGAAYVGINLEDLRLLPVCAPILSEQLKIVAHLDLLNEEIQRLASVYERKLAALDALRESLLHQAFSGELLSTSMIEAAE